MATSGPTAAGQPYRFKIGGPRRVSPTISFNNQKSTFNNLQFFHQPRRWRQVGRPRRVSPTVLRAPPRIRQSRSCHRREQSFAHSGVRSVAHSLGRSLPFRRFPRRWNPTCLSSVQNLHLPFASVRVIRGSISSSASKKRILTTDFTTSTDKRGDLGFGFRGSVLSVPIRVI